MSHYVLIGLNTRTVFDWGSGVSVDTLLTLRSEWDLGEPTIVVTARLAETLQRRRATSR